jgi:hypothetical protein
LVEWPIKNNLDLSIAKNYLALQGLAGEYTDFKKYGSQIIASINLDTCDHSILSSLLGLYTNIVGIAVSQRDSSFALDNYIKHQELIARCGGSDIDLVQVRANIVRLQILNGNFSEASKIINFLKDYQGEIAAFSSGDFHLIKLLYFQKTREIDSAFWHMNRASEAFISLGITNRALEPLDFMLKRAEQGLSLEQTLWIAKRSNFLRDSLNFTQGENYHQLLESFSTIYSLEEEIEASRQRRIWYLVLTVFAVLIGCILFFIFRLKQARLRVRSSELEIQVVRDKMRFEKQKQELQDSILYLQSQISDQRMDWWQSFNEQKQKVRNLSVSRQSLVDAVDKYIPTFEMKLKKKYPNITPSEYAILLTTLLGFSVKQASEILCVSENSYRVAKSRL